MNSTESKPQGSEQHINLKACVLKWLSSATDQELLDALAEVDKELLMTPEQQRISEASKTACIFDLPNPSADEEVEPEVQAEIDRLNEHWSTMPNPFHSDVIDSALLEFYRKFIKPRITQLRQQHNAERERIVREGREAVRKRNNQIDELTGKLSHLRESHAELKSIYDETENERQGFLSELQQLRASLAEKDKEIQELRKSLEAEIAERDYLRTQLGGEFK